LAERIQREKKITAAVSIEQTTADPATADR
jgi:hypothetical protein